MENISERVISFEEAKAALRCMRLGGLSEEEALESLDETAERIRKVTTAKLVESIIEEKLSAVQREYFTKYWYERKNTAQIARECGVSQAGVYRAIERANETIKELMTPLIRYQQNLMTADVVGVTQEALEICSAEKCVSSSFCDALRNLRVARGISQDCLSRALKISVRELNEIENGMRVPSIVTAMRYSVLFGIEIKMTFVNGKGVYEWKRA